MAVHDLMHYDVEIDPTMCDDAVRETYIHHIDVNRSYSDRHSLNVARQMAAVAEYTMRRQGNRTWIITQETFAILSSLRINAEFGEDLTLPYDAFGLCFELGCTIPGTEMELQAMRVGRINNAVVRALKPGEPFREASIIASARVGNCADVPSGVGVLYEFRPFANSEVKLADNMKSFAGLIDYLTGLVLKVVLLWHARPEIVQQVGHIPRSLRGPAPKQQFKTASMIKMPDKLILHHRNQLAQSTGRTVTPHWRGYVLRHLRNERYKRNEDGSVKTVLVEPCLVGVKDKEEDDALASPAGIGGAV